MKATSLFLPATRRFQRSALARTIQRLALPAALFAATVAQVQTVPEFNPAGLWVGDVTLNQVTHIATGNIETTPSTVQLRLLLHTDANGRVRLLKEVIIARNATNDTEMVLISDPARLSQYPVARDPVTSTAKAQRMATAAYDFVDNDGTSDNALDLTGALSTQGSITGSLLLPPTHVSNPFRHAFNPDLGNNGTRSYSITHDLVLQLTELDTSVNGTSRFTGTYEQTVTGVNRVPLKARGTLILSRLTAVASLNP